jgi:hypothetical protein
MEGVSPTGGLILSLASGVGAIFDVAGQTTSSWIVVMLTLGAVSLGVTFMWFIVVRALWVVYWKSKGY